MRLSLLLKCLICLLPFFSQAQNSTENPCISAQQYAIVEQNCSNNIEILGLKTKDKDNLETTLLYWPLKAANGIDDCRYYAISAYVDQNTSPGATTDYNCGLKTYDGHRGTDISIWPFPFYKMDYDQVQVIAAAAGTIIDKLDGNFDKNCGSNNLSANYLVIQHADGSQALYFHMKKNSLTAKGIGQMVAKGEYLGVVGSSGNSSGPHLHFEVWAGSTVSTRIDPYSGACNSLNPTSWWAAQPAYAGPEILKASVHTTDAVLPACPTTETPNESSCYQIPFQGPGLPAGTAKFYIFMRYETAGLVADLKILNPDNSTYLSWTYTSANTSNAGVRSWTRTLPPNPGTYTFVSSYNGSTCSKTFDILSPSVTANGPTTFCEGNSVMLSASTGSSYLWSNGTTTKNITVSISGQYTVTVTSTHGCTVVSDPISVTVNPLPTATVTAGSPTSFCQGISVLLNANAATSYWWNNGATTQGIIVSTSGNYIVTVTNSNGCSTVSTPTAVTVYPVPDIPIITASGNQLSSSSPTGNQWYLNGSILAGANSQTYSALQNGQYSVYVSNSYGCYRISAIFNFMNTGTQIIQEDKCWHILPNPNNGIFMVRNSHQAAARIEVYNSIGSKILSTDYLQEEPEIDISSQPNGIYFVRVSSEGYEQIVQIIKMG